MNRIRFSIPFSGLALGILLGGCNRGADLQSNGSTLPDSLGIATDSHALFHPVHDSLAQDTFQSPDPQGEFSIPQAMEIVYGLYDKKMECAQWVCAPNEKSAFQSKIGPNGKLYTRAAGTLSFTEHGQEHIFLLTETAEMRSEGWEDCHACAPIVGVALFVNEGGSWQLEALKRDLDLVGSYGEMPPAETLLLGKENHGIRLDVGYTNQGFTEGDIILVGMPNFHFSSMLEIHDAVYSNEGFYSEDFHPERLASYETKLRFHPGSNPHFDDLEVLTVGARPKNQTAGTEVTPFEMIRTYRANGDHYLMVDSTFEWKDEIIQ